MARWEKDSGQDRLTSDKLSTFSTKLLRSQVADMPLGPRRAAIERAIAYAERWPNSYLARNLDKIYGVEP